MLGLGKSLLKSVYTITDSRRVLAAINSRAQSLLSTFSSRVEEDGGEVENPSCLRSSLKDLLTGSDSLLIDRYVSPAAAYSLRKLRRDYLGPAIRVRRFVDAEEQDIFFDSAGNLDTASLDTFCAGTDGYVSVWYDQANGNDATQTTKTSQPKIYDSSTGVVTENEKPALKFDVDNLSPSITNAASDYSFFSVTKSDVSLANAHTIDVQSGRLIFDGRGSSLGVYLDGAWQGTPHNSTVQQVNSIFAIAPTSGQSYINGSVVNTGLSYTQKPLGGTIRIGQNSVGSSNYWNGTMQEIVLYASDQSSNRTGIESNINDFYNIYS